MLDTYKTRRLQMTRSHDFFVKNRPTILLTKTVAWIMNSQLAIADKNGFTFQVFVFSSKIRESWCSSQRFWIFRWGPRLKSQRPPAKFSHLPIVKGKVLLELFATLRLTWNRVNVAIAQTRSSGNPRKKPIRNNKTDQWYFIDF